ncbi:transcriptional regulator WAR1 [Corynascus novoguineensis]|uniref:Transcriptional regulator WAR1 n=1 Tax=Corynascus novoguineensis TaxID=1126955 RepID=A0AAN7HJ24_9PEZI|nr:transcriptional regulator WAR1 [Corynascus novoguineensis]
MASLPFSVSTTQVCRLLHPLRMEVWVFGSLGLCVPASSDLLRSQTIKWGTACAQCAAAKAKCSGRPTDPDTTRDRCERLLKQCTDQVHKPRKTRQSRTTETGSTSFEFDSLVSTPENPSSPMTGASAQGVQNPPHFTRAPLTFSQQNVEGGFAATAAVYHSDPHILSPGSPDQANADIVLEGRDDLDQKLLSTYQTELMPQHSFVIVPEHMSAAVLKAHFPFLMMTIRVIASFESLSTMHARMRTVSLRLTDRMFRQYEQSLDLLMGIVVILGWHHYRCSKHSQLNSLLCLAEATAEEKRLLLGVCYLRSSAAMHLQQFTSMPFTPFMRQSLVELQEGKKHSLDEALAQCVKIQYLAERIAVLKSPQLRNTASRDKKAVLDMGEQKKETQELEAALSGCRD